MLRQQALKYYNNPSLVNRNNLLLNLQRLFHKYIHKYNTPKLLHSDLLQEINLAVLKALPNFNPNKSQITTYLHFHIRNSLRDYIYRNSHIVPSKRKDTGYTPIINNFTDEDEKELICPSTPIEKLIADLENVHSWIERFKRLNTSDKLLVIYTGVDTNTKKELYKKYWQYSDIREPTVRYLGNKIVKKLCSIV